MYTFTLIDYIGLALDSELEHGGREINNFGRRLPGLHKVHSVYFTKVMKSRRIILKISNIFAILVPMNHEFTI